MKHIYSIHILSLFIENADLEEADRLLDVYKKGDGIYLLQDFVGAHLKPEFSWVTTIGVIDAMEKIVTDAIGNGNIAKNSA